MGRPAAKATHLTLVAVGILLYFVFVLPRWWVLVGDIPDSLSTAGRIAAGFPLALAALPVLTILRQSLGRKANTPELALRFRAWSAVLHVVAGALIVLAAIAEIWLGLGTAGPYLFGVYGAAAAIAILAVLALYLSFVAEKKPAEPKPSKPAKLKKAKKAKAEKKPRGKKRDVTSAVPEETAPTETHSGETAGDGTTADEAADDQAAPIEAGPDETAGVEFVTVGGAGTLETSEAAGTAQPAASNKLLNQRPSGKLRRRLGR